MDKKIELGFLVTALLSAFLIIGCAGNKPEEAKNDAAPKNDAINKDDAPKDDDPASKDGAMAKDTAESSSTGELLAAMNWTLVSVRDGQNEASQTLSSGISTDRYKLSFIEQNVQLLGGCNNASSNFTIDAESDDNISFGIWRSTKRAGEPALMEADSELQNLLSGVTQCQLKDRKLRLIGGGKTLLFFGTATDEARFGGKGKRRFINIRNSDSGLVWRVAEYNESWIQINKDAPWIADDFPGIRNFTPELNRQYTVRINEFQDERGEPVWVKDMVTMQGLYEDN